MDGWFLRLRVWVNGWIMQVGPGRKPADAVDDVEGSSHLCLRDIHVCAVPAQKLADGNGKVLLKRVVPKNGVS